jgi:predicted MPP superfamily phosphohydrolase
LSLHWNRRRFLQATAVVGAGALALAGDGIPEANHPQLVRLNLPLTRLPAALDGFSIAHLSDIHYDQVFSAVPLRKAVNMVNDFHPDLVVITGDFVTIPVFSDYLHNEKRGADTAEAAAQALSQIRARRGVFAVLGNHDHDSDPDRVIAALAAKGIQMLRNHSVPIEAAGARLWLSGVDDVLVGKPDLDLTLKGIPGDEPVVLLSHEPDFADRAAKYPIDLQLSGHSHGGQIRLPLVGALFLPDLARKYPWGLRTIGRLTLYTNVGLGTVRIPARLNCPPEITLITLRASQYNNGGTGVPAGQRRRRAGTGSAVPSSFADD